MKIGQIRHFSQIIDDNQVKNFHCQLDLAIFAVANLRRLHLRLKLWPKRETKYKNNRDLLQLFHQCFTLS